MQGAVPCPRLRLALPLCLRSFWRGPGVPRPKCKGRLTSLPPGHGMGSKERCWSKLSLVSVPSPCHLLVADAWVTCLPGPFWQQASDSILILSP